MDGCKCERSLADGGLCFLCVQTPMASDLDLDIDRDPWKDSRTSNAPYLNKAPGEYPSLRKKCESSP